MWFYLHWKGVWFYPFTNNQSVSLWKWVIWHKPSILRTWVKVGWEWCIGNSCAHKESKHLKRQYFHSIRFYFYFLDFHSFVFDFFSRRPNCRIIFQVSFYPYLCQWTIEISNVICLMIIINYAKCMRHWI